MKRNNNKIIRSVTVPYSIDFFKDVMLIMNERGYENIVVTSPGDYLEDFKKNNSKIRCVEVSMQRGISIFQDIKSLCKLIYTIAKERPIMVHSMTPKAGLLSMLAAFLTGVPFRIHTFTGLVWSSATGSKRKILMFADKVLCLCATHVIPEGQGVLNDLKEYGVCKKQMKVLGYGNVMGVDMCRFNPYRLSIEKDNTKFTFLFVGRVVGDKGINEMVDAFVRLNKKYNLIRLRIIGGLYQDLDPIKKQTLELIKANKNIDFLGILKGDELIKQYSLSDCFVMPSYREGFPNSVLEAGAMNLPSIVTDINGSREIIIDEIEYPSCKNEKIKVCKNGIIVPSKDTDTLYEAMEIMYLDKNLRESMANCSREMIGSRFERSFVQKCQLDFYDEILNS